MKHILTILFFVCLTGNLLAQKNTLDTGIIKNPNATPEKKPLNNGIQRKTDSTTLELERKIFGYNVFHNPSTTFTPNLNMPAPKNYVVGPGDILSVQVYGVAQSTYTLAVNNEGNVNIIDIGVAHVGGLTIEAAKSLFEKRLALRYSGMNGANPNTFIEVSLANIRSIKVNIVGEVGTPGSYVFPSYTNIFNALFAAGGPTVKGTFRDIQVYRANRLAGQIDLYDYLVNGKASANIRLEDNDVILVRTASSQVEIAGEVRTPGIFEMKTSETFADLLKFSGGFTGNAYKQLVKVQRKGAAEFQAFDLSITQFNKTRLMDGDLINVDVIATRYDNRVQVNGSVNRPGAFELVSGMTVGDLIQRAGGLKGDAFRHKVLLYRTKTDYTQETIDVDVSNETSPGNSIKLQKEDVLSVASIYDLKQEFYIQVTGEVNNSGVYPYTDNMTVSDIIFIAGGFKYSASGSYIEVVRRNVDDPSKVADIITVNINKDLSMDTGSRMHLMPFDHIFVRNTPGFQAPKLVNIQGEILYGGTFAIDKKEMKISDLITRAGGPTKYAYTRGATLLRKTKEYSGPTPSELENANLQQLLANLRSDTLAATTESNKEYIRRIKDRIELNNKEIVKEQEIKNKENLKKEVVKENTANLQQSNARVIQEKTEDLVAVDLDAILARPGGPEDLVLKDGDILNIPEKQETVRIKGGVLYPVSVRHQSDLGFSDYINRAGGYDTKAIRNKAYVIQANGKIQRVKTFLFFKSYPTVEPGAEIVVPATLAEKPPFNATTTIGLITGLITSVLTLYFVFKNL